MQSQIIKEYENKHVLFNNCIAIVLSYFGTCPTAQIYEDTTLFWIGSEKNDY
jgi:trans-2-enoyl-CoA reductase